MLRDNRWPAGPPLGQYLSRSQKRCRCLVAIQASPSLSGCVSRACIASWTTTSRSSGSSANRPSSGSGAISAVSSCAMRVCTSASTVVPRACASRRARSLVCGSSSTTTVSKVIPHFLAQFSGELFYLMFEDTINRQVFNKRCLHAIGHLMWLLLYTLPRGIQRYPDPLTGNASAPALAHTHAETLPDRRARDWDHR